MPRVRRRAYLLSLAWLWLVPFLPARQDPSLCATSRESWREALQLHRQAARIRRQQGLRTHQAGRPAPNDEPASAARQLPAFPDIVLLEDSGGVVARRNEFNLDRRTLVFSPSGAGYRYSLAGPSFDEAEAQAGTPLPLADDDARLVSLPFSFPFFGRSYRSVYINSDGNLTFTASDTSTSERSLGRLTSGPPRIAGLFRDLDPSLSSQGVRVLSQPGRLVVSWVAVPEYREYGIGPLQTFQVRLFADGRIEFAYNGITTSSAVVGIAPGYMQGATAVVCFICGEDDGREFTAAIAERFGTSQEVDIVTAAQLFYQAHEDAYDYLVIFNAVGIPAAENALAYEVTVRNNATGIGDPPRDIGREFGSARRLKAVVNMGPLSQYPRDPQTPLPGRPQSRESTLAILAHEVGHLFLAYASIRDPSDPRARPLLGRQLAHWSFVFNSEASHLEGNRIRDYGAGTRPRFLTIGNAEQYAPLDQYLMGLRAPEEVEPVFLVTGATVSANRAPERGVAFHGDRLDVRVEDIIAAEGPRRPDHTVAQRRYRAAFLLVIGKGAEPSQEDLQKLDQLRQQFEAYFRDSAGGRAQMETSLRRALHVSAFPAAGVLQGSSIPVTVSVEKPVEAPLVVSLRAAGSLIQVPSSVTIPAGTRQARFQLSGLRAGVDELLLEPADNRYEAIVARIQVSASTAGLKLHVVSGDKQAAVPGQPLPEPAVVRLVDANYVPYPGLLVAAKTSPGGSVTPAEAVTDEEGVARFQWTPGPGPLHELVLTAAGSSTVVTALSRPQIMATGVVNAASYRPGLSPGSLGSIFGTSLAGGASLAAAYPWPRTLAGVQVRINATAVPLLAISDRQINFLVPLEMPPGEAELVVVTPLGESNPVKITLAVVSPGLFFHPADGSAAAVVAGTGLTTRDRPVGQDEYLEIYATGLGPLESAGSNLRRTVLAPRVFIGGREATELNYSGLAPGFLGLYQINARVPPGVPSGWQSLFVEIGGQRSNEVRVRVR